jgi:UDP-N-acetylglucosamine 4-epimerase
LREICVAGGRDTEPIFGPPRVGDIAHSQADISLAREALGYEVVVPFHEGIARTVAWYRAQKDAARSETPSATSDA